MIEAISQAANPVDANGAVRSLPPRAEMDRAMLSRDAAYDGIFWTAVLTTRIFCRPTCPARKPKVENVEYYATIRDALSAGFRPCKRCRPLDTPGAPPEWLDDLLERVEQNPAQRITDGDLRSLSMDPARVRRYFLNNYGLTFQAYHRARRMGMALTQLRRGGDALIVGFDHGFESASGFRDAFQKTIGTTPGRARVTQAIVTATIPSPIGPLMTAATDDGVCLLEFADRRAIEKQLAVLQRRLPGPLVPGTHPFLDQLSAELAEYFDGERTAFDVPLVLRGTPFQESVWEHLLKIPYGDTMSYEGLARAIGRPGAQRAVGRANGDNRIAILIPCHRVVQKDGKLRGYGGGLWRKQFLLDLESPRVR